MTLLLALAAQALHGVLILAAAPVLAGLPDWIEARLVGRAGGSWHGPWHELRRLTRKQRVRSENASPLFAAAPIACFAALAVAALLVPSFTLGMALAPFGDLLVIGGLLALARLVVLLAALDDGTAQGGVAARQGLALTVCAEPALLVAMLALGMMAGTTNVDLIAGLQQVRMMQPMVGVSLTAVALVLVAVAQLDTDMPAAAFSGPDLALLRLADALRLLLWCDLIGALFLPAGLAAADNFPAGWAVGLLSWLARIGLLTVLLSLMRAVSGRLPPRRLPALLAVSLLLALLATVLVITVARPV